MSIPFYVYLAQHLLYSISNNKLGGKNMKILLVCAAGMSTSLVVEKMKKALNPEDGDSIIVAVPVDEFENVVADYDVVLLGPQIRFKKPEFVNIVKQYNIPLDVIDTMNYGLCKGDKILEQARNLILNNNK